MKLILSAVVTPPEGAVGAEMGLILIPGAQIPGERYSPLAQQIQAQLADKAKVWVGVTKSFLGNFPNPLEISGAINDCLSQAAAGGLGGPVYMAGHSLGGIMLETYIKDHGDLTNGIILLGSYLPDLFGDESNQFPVPVLTAVGELDGLTISYVYREYKESKVAEEAQGVSGRYPVVVLDDVNHGQVASGEIPSFVTDFDIPSPLDFEEAHIRYAQAVSAFIVSQEDTIFTADQVQEANNVLADLAVFTEDFLVPFAETSMMESDGDLDNPSSPWMIEGQKILLGATEEELAELSVTDIVVPFSDLGDFKPSVESSGDCGALVTTCCFPQYEWNPADANTLYSAKVIKAKFKLEDNVRESLCLPEAPRRQCRDLNQEAFNLALSLASEEARERFESLGTKLVFIDDSVSPWGPGWEFQFNLHYENINATHTSVFSTSLISEPDFIIASAAGMHYCDLLSPFRALEWIYITSLQGKTL